MEILKVKLVGSINEIREDICTICFNPLAKPCSNCTVSSSCKSILGVCSHYYHAHCITQLTEHSALCPTCRVKWEVMVNPDYKFFSKCKIPNDFFDDVPILKPISKKPEKDDSLELSESIDESDDTKSCTEEIASELDTEEIVSHSGSTIVQKKTKKNVVHDDNKFNSPPMSEEIRTRFILAVANKRMKKNVANKKTKKPDTNHDHSEDSPINSPSISIMSSNSDLTLSNENYVEVINNEMNKSCSNLKSAFGEFNKENN